jgi:hypothetical protein
MDNTLGCWSDAWIRRCDYPGLEEPTDADVNMDSLGFLRYTSEFFCLAVERVRDMDQVLERHKAREPSKRIRATESGKLIEGFTGSSLGFFSLGPEF